MSIDVNYYPGWTRKAITFTMDDGNVTYDKRLIDLVKAAGIKGTFNLCTPLKALPTAEEYRAFYRGFEIANHGHLHPYATSYESLRPLKNEIFDPATADPHFAYLTEEEGIFRVHHYGWSYLAANEQYLACVDTCQRELEAVFGEGSIKDYVWPYSEQDNSVAQNGVKRDRPFRSVRKTGCVKGDTGYALPADRKAWSYNANVYCMEETAAQFRALPDDGTLKFYCFGVHAGDFEKAGRWDILEDFCRDFGNRPEEFYYATVGEIFDYEDAVCALVVTDKEIQNPTSVDVYVKINGECKVVFANSSISL